MSDYRPGLQDKIVVKAANLILRLASPHYQKFLRGVVIYGMAAALRDGLEGREPPTPDEWMLR